MDQKIKMVISTELFEKELNIYAKECFPKTSSLLFKIGFADVDKITKKEDSFRVEGTFKSKSLSPSICSK